MARHLRTALALGALLGFTGCKQANPSSCELDQNQDKPECQGIDVDAPEQCDQACVAPLDICLMGECVECVTSADCDKLAVEPVCNNQNVCVGCTANDQCTDSDVCLPDGACADMNDVAYVQGGATGDCSKASPCGLISTALDTNKGIIKVNASATSVIEPNTVVIDGRTVSIVGDAGAKLESNSSGFIIEVKGAGVNVSISELEIAGKNVNGNAIHFTTAGSGSLEKLRLSHVIVHRAGGLGLFATSSSSDELTIERSIFAGNIGGGANIQTLVVNITNSIFVRNGNNADTSGGVTLSARPGSVFSFNTIADNTNDQPIDGLICVNTFPVENMIHTGDVLGAMCTMVTYSLFDGVVVGDGNKMGAANFEETAVANVTGSSFYRIMGNSPARNAANPAATEADDIDGIGTRPVGAPDMGADEAPQ